MGLDNGIMLIVTPEIANSKIFKRLFGKEELYYSYTFETNTVEVCYWRKCWGIRNDILSLLEPGEEEYRFWLTEYDIENIIDVLKSYNRESWNEGCNYWDWDDSYPNSRKKKLKREVKQLRKLLKLLKKIDAKVYFYDSY